MGATSWTEQSATLAADWQEGVPGRENPSDDYFIDLLFEGTTFYDPGVTWSEQSMSSTSMTEKTQSATSWTEVSG